MIIFWAVVSHESALTRAYSPPMIERLHSCNRTRTTILILARIDENCEYEKWLLFDTHRKKKLNWNAHANFSFQMRNYLRRLHVACAHVRFTDKNLKANGFGRLLSAFRNADRINVIGRAASNVLKFSYHFQMFWILNALPPLPPLPLLPLAFCGLPVYMHCEWSMRFIGGIGINAAQISRYLVYVCLK